MGSRLARGAFEPNLLLRAQNCSLNTTDLRLAVRNHGSYETAGKIVIRGSIYRLEAVKYKVAEFHCTITNPDDAPNLEYINASGNDVPSLNHPYEALYPGETFIVDIPSDCNDSSLDYMKKLYPIYPGMRYEVRPEFEFYSGYPRGDATSNPDTTCSYIQMFSHATVILEVKE